MNLGFRSLRVDLEDAYAITTIAVHEVVLVEKP